MIFSRKEKKLRVFLPQADGTLKATTATIKGSTKDGRQTVVYSTADGHIITTTLAAEEEEIKVPNKQDVEEEDVEEKEETEETEEKEDEEPDAKEAMNKTEWYSVWEKMITDPEADTFTHLHSQILNGGMEQAFFNIARNDDYTMTECIRRTLPFVEKYAPGHARQYSNIMDKYVEDIIELSEKDERDEYGNLREDFNANLYEALNKTDNIYFDFYEDMESEMGDNYKAQKLSACKGKGKKKKGAMQGELSVGDTVVVVGEGIHDVSYGETVDLEAGEEGTVVELLYDEDYGITTPFVDFGFTNPVPCGWDEIQKVGRANRGVVHKSALARNARKQANTPMLGRTVEWDGGKGVVKDFNAEEQYWEVESDDGAAYQMGLSTQYNENGSSSDLYVYQKGQGPEKAKRVNTLARTRQTAFASDKSVWNNR